MATFYGSGVGGDHPDRVVLRTVATVNSQNTLNNKSNITVKVYGYYNYHQYTPPNPYEGSQYIKVDDVTKHSGSFNANLQGTSSSKPQFFMQWTGDVNHNADGRKTVNLKLYQNTPNVKTMNYMYGNHNWTLPTIPRNSKITSFPNFTIGNGVTVKAPRESTTFTNKYELYAGNTLIHRTGNLASDTYTFTSSQTNSIYNTIPTKTSTYITLRVTTYSGINRVGGIESRVATATVGSDVKPTFTGITVSETNTKVSALSLGANQYAQTLSSPKATINGATGNGGASITAYEIKLGGIISTKSSATYSNLNLVGGNRVYVRVKDSRGRWSDTKNVLLTFHSYSYPKITKLTGFRTSTSSSTSLSIMGEYHRTQYAGSISSLNGKNKLTYAVHYKKSDDSTFIQLEKNTLSTNSFSYTKNFGDGTNYFKIIHSYDIRLNVVDSIGNIASITMLMPTGNVPMSFGKEGIGAGKVWERGALDIGVGGVYLDGDKLIDSGTNSNGQWVRFYDGTQICYNTTQFTMPPIIPIGGIYGTSTGDYQTLTFPKPFISKPTVTVRTEVGEELNCSTRTVTTTECTWRLFLYAPATEGSVRNVSFNAIGRWK